MHTTEPAFTMLDLGPYPGVIAAGSTPITGEVYRVAPALLRRIDQLENYPHTYHRILLNTPFGTAWCYLYRQARGDETRVASGDWLTRQ